MSRSEARWLLWPPLLFFAIVLAVPLVALVHEMLAGRGSLGEVLGMGLFWSSVERTLILAVLVTMLTVLIGALYALGMAVAPRWLLAILMGFLFVSLWTSTLVRTFGWMLLEFPTGALFQVLHLLGLREDSLELYQTTLGMYPALVNVMLPYTVLPIYAAVVTTDRDQIKAARIFGAGPVGTFRLVVLPHIAPNILSGAVLVFVMSLGVYVTPVLLGGPQNFMVSALINLEMNSANRPDLGAAMSVLLLGGTLLIYLAADRVFKISEKWS
jgi:putative spermidine/putrescine transport system permease protein